MCVQAEATQCCLRLRHGMGHLLVGAEVLRCRANFVYEIISIPLPKNRETKRPAFISRPAE